MVAVQAPVRGGDVAPEIPSPVFISDTTPAAQAVLTRLYRVAGPERCLRMALQMSDECRRVSESGARARMPSASDDEVRWEVARLYLGDELADRVRRWRNR